MTGQETALVLWGQGCDEVLAVTWVSHLRAQGRRVYLVGVSGRRMRGKFGVGLMCDTGLDQALALAAQAALIVLPCEENALHRFCRDPRFEELLLLAGERGARFLAHPLAVEFLEALLPAAVIDVMAKEE
ncbi:MAG: hypothetical protein KF753_10500 [Caldilineaceae bacterium]|nr:hypothetical protein [Caldilineaceae bacterium]